MSVCHAARLNAIELITKRGAERAPRHMRTRSCGLPALVMADIGNGRAPKRRAACSPGLKSEEQVLVARGEMTEVQ